jgi:cytochrome c oxidase subunit 3
MLFVSFFWAFLHGSLAPSVELGCQYPPIGVTPVGTFTLPLFGTIVLVSSGFTLTVAHHGHIAGYKNKALAWLSLTVFLGFFFCFCQFLEYKFTEFTIADSVFGSAFFLATGLHFMHMIAGSLFLLVMLIRIYKDNFSSEHNLGFEASILYYHGCDIVWLLLFFLFYYWCAP